MSTEKKTTIWQWLMIPALFLVPLVLAFFVGQLSVVFDSNVCYSESMEKLRDLSSSVIGSNNPALQQKYIELVKTLPLYGYETSCKALSASVSKVSNQLGYAATTP